MGLPWLFRGLYSLFSIYLHVMYEVRNRTYILYDIHIIMYITCGGHRLILTSCYVCIHTGILHVH